MIQDWANIYVRRLRQAQRKLGIVAAGFMPTGGATGDVLAKASPVDYDVSWQPLLGGIITVGNGLVNVGNTIHFSQAAAYTSGAIPFATSASSIGFDATNLFWDNAIKGLKVGGFVGIGTSPSTSTRLLLAASTTDVSGLRFTQGSAPTVLVDGDMWTDSTEKSLDLYLNGVERHLSGTIFDQTTSQVIANTSNETTLFGAGMGTLTLPANFWVPGTTVHAELRGKIANTGTPTGRVRAYLGATLLLDTTAINTGPLTGDEYWRCSLKMCCRTAGSPGTIACAMGFEYHQGVTASGVVMIETIPAVVNVTTTGALAVNITWAWGTANASNTLTTITGSLAIQQ